MGTNPKGTFCGDERLCYDSTTNRKSTKVAYFSKGLISIQNNTNIHLVDAMRYDMSDQKIIGMETNFPSRNINY